MGEGVGRVVAFDEAVGIGTVEADGGERYFFHCTAIADGTRTIEQGAPVRFSVVAGQRGRWEAAAVRAVGTPPGPGRPR